jgi:hypothetical protein
MATQLAAPATASEEFIRQTSMINIFGHEINVYATMLITAFILFIYAVYRANKDQTNVFEWTDMITGINQTTGKREASTSKLLQLVGGITATFIVVKLTIQGTINWDIFAVYLGYVASVDSFSRFILAKYGVKGQPDTTKADTGSAKPKDD